MTHPRQSYTVICVCRDADGEINTHTAHVRSTTYRGAQRTGMCAAMGASLDPQNFIQVLMLHGTHLDVASDDYTSEFVTEQRDRTGLLAKV